MNSTPVNTAPSIVHDVLNSSGQPLDEGTRAFMEPRFGHDFSQVRIHTDERAVESAEAVNALAYTVGRNVVFGEGQYAPGTYEGQMVLAHELTHVVQQDGSAGEHPTRIDLPGSHQEQEASRIARSIALPSMRSKAEIAQGQVPAQLQRLSAGDDDPIHKPIIDQYRREHGLPPGGVDAEGNPVGPSDAEIKYYGGAIGGSMQQAQVAAPAPAVQQVPGEQAQALSKQPLPPNVTVNGTQGQAQPGSDQAQTPQTPAPTVVRIPNEPVKFGLDTSLDSTYNFQLSFVARHWDYRRYAVRGVPVDIVHEPTMTLGVSLNSASFGTLMAQLAVSALNVHIQQHGQDLIELALGQIGLGFDSTGKRIVSLGAQAEIHSVDPHLSFTISGGGTVSCQSGACSAQWSPLTFGILVHWANP